jgi:hypothetical protein
MDHERAAPRRRRARRPPAPGALPLVRSTNLPSSNASQRRTSSIPGCRMRRCTVGSKSRAFNRRESAIDRNQRSIAGIVNAARWASPALPVRFDSVLKRTGRDLIRLNFIPP